MSKAVKMWDTAQYWKYRAAGALSHAKYRERPDVRARRIKKIKADLDRVIRSFTPKNPNEQITQTPFYCPVCMKYNCQEHPEAKERTPHVYCGASRGGSWVPVSRLEKIKAASQRWIAHYENRLEYEKAMLGEQGASDLLKPKPRPKQPPLLNYRAPEGVTIKDKWNGNAPKTYQQIEMTKAEYKRVGRDYSCTEFSIDGSHRVRVSMYTADYKRCGLAAVFLTNSKVHPKPEPKEPEPENTHVKLLEAQERIHARHISQYKGRPENPYKEVKVETVVAPQLFPTPPDIAAKMVEVADIRPGHSVLEPSAGTGALIDAMPNVRPNGYVEAVEISHVLSQYLKDKADKTHNQDFLEMNGELGTFDRIVMNPPFKNGVDIKHINKALEYLKPGGRLVALCANGPRQQAEFKDRADYWEPLPEGSFKTQGTGGNVSLMVLEKP
jgi:protein-L-isoaspartate O-methyltransferase